MVGAEIGEEFVPCRRLGKEFDYSFNIDACGVAEVIYSRLGVFMEVSGSGMAGKVNFGSGPINISVTGSVVLGEDNSYSGDLSVDMTYDKYVTSKHKSKVRGVFGDIGLVKKFG